MTREGLVALSAALVFVTPGAYALESRRGGQLQVDPRRQAELQRIEMLRATQGLHAAALASPGRRYVGFEMIDPDEVAANLEAVAWESEVVVRGELGANLTRIARDTRGKETVVLDYDVRVLEVLKGHPDSLTGGLTWTNPGGVYRFADGAMVEILTPEFRKPLSGEEYVLFLRKGATFGNYRLAWGTQALFRLHPDGRVESGAKRPFPTGEGVLDVSRDVFLERVRKAVASMEPEPRLPVSRPT